MQWITAGLTTREYSETATPTSWPQKNEKARPIRAIDAAGIEVSHLWRYLAVAGMAAGCALLSTWSRIDLVETSVALHQMERNLTAATMDGERLDLELATLKAPDRLDYASQTLQLDDRVQVIDVPPLEGSPPR